ncbi:MAG: glycogen/starch/alpha-glucan phosphorylase [Peptococcaceae bacterium]|jgi:starch phosphorylase|nr:glycogen/starch/alpha-glucan phosphorylase [Peptococcaceae bacterium]
MNKKDFRKAFVNRLETLRGISIEEAAPEDCYSAMASLIKEQVTKRWVQTNQANQKNRRKQVYYFSLEFMLGKMLENNILSLGLKDVCEGAMKDLGLDIHKIYDVEADPGLGNGGLGRLAACFMDSLAFLGLPGHGCSIRYKYGLFEQKIENGCQVETPDNWLRNENVWEIKKPNKAIVVKFFGEVKEREADGRQIYDLENCEQVVAMPYDVPMVGADKGAVNNLRLWSAESVRQFNFESFSSGNYLNAISDKYSAEAISEVLYPDDSNYQNRMLRLKQQYFFVSAGIQSILRHYKSYYGDIRSLPDYISIHINDTHPALAVPELMRLLLDEYGLDWDEAWDITVRTISYTNHTIMPEALERWSVDTYARLLPRIYMITHEINERFCQKLWGLYEGQWDRIRRMAIEADGEIRMAYLAIVGSHAINGVARIHSEILIHELFKDFYEVYPERFNNKTNGVTQRRWLIQSNPDLSTLITKSIGPEWKREPLTLSLLDQKGLTRDGGFLDKLWSIKRQDKLRLAAIIWEKNKVAVNPDSIFDVQVKRIHAYKRQLLMVMNILNTYFDLLDHPELEIVPRTFIFGGKAAPSYHFAKETIKLISAVANRINNDPRIRDLIKVVFLENYRVSLAEYIFPASDISEQISTASREASGTGNMKFMMNGAVTVGTMDGANIEIREAAGEENFIAFGLSAAEVLGYYRDGTYRSRDVYEADERIRRIVREVINTHPNEIGKAEFPYVYDSLLTYNDEFFVLKDFDAYVAAQKRVDELYRDRRRWFRMSAMNIAYSGRFSSDEVIRQYAREIWHVG